ncbi:hypothetical protein XELAEV_18029090mg [Xenopus laevis]|uniref:Uncharacterized protein n=1 Tax=Xenopus laevis TaxID=8355 RepID=A0A974CR18_XENLA|nr:hypothetical protein XELAEV_18029090mg [Xenopus laevis]
MDKITGPRTDLLGTGRRYQWAGFFAEKLTTEGKLLLIPVCAGCGGELRWGIIEVEGSCASCHRKHYVGPFYLDQLPPNVRVVDKLLTKLKMQTHPAVIAEPQLLLFTGQLPPEPVVQSSPKPVTPEASMPVTELPLQSVEVDQTVPELEECVPDVVAAPLLDASVVPPPDTATPAQSLIPPSIIAVDETAAVAQKHDRGKHHAQFQGNTTGTPWQEDWEQYGVDSVSAVGNRSVLPISEACFPSAAITDEDTILPKEATEFWVLPGEASPREFRAISKVQRKINYEVHQPWGYFMSYAPEWIYRRVEACLKDWVDQDILLYLQLDRNSLELHNSMARNQAKEQVTACLLKWWLGRTVLRTHVRSVCKRAPERRLSTNVEVGDGRVIEKPHPAYYTSHAITKHWFHRMV